MKPMKMKKVCDQIRNDNLCALYSYNKLKCSIYIERIE